MKNIAKLLLCGACCWAGQAVEVDKRLTAAAKCERGNFTFEDLRLHAPSLSSPGEVIPHFAGTLVNNTDSVWTAARFRVTASGLNPRTGKRESRLYTYSLPSSVQPGQRFTFTGYAGIERPYLDIDTVTAEMVDGKRLPSESERLVAEEAKLAAQKRADGELKVRRETRLNAQKAYLSKLPSGKWRTRTSKSEFDDSVVVTLSLTAERAVSGWPGKRALPVLMARCKEGNTDFYVVLGFPPQPEAQSGVTIRYRLDKQEAEEETVSRSTDGEAVFFSDGQQFLQMVEEEAYGTMLFEFTPFNTAPQTTTFDLRGLSNVVGPLRKACGW